MKTFNEHQNIVNYEFKVLNETEFTEFSLEERVVIDEQIKLIKESINNDSLDEGLLTNILGGIGGLIIGPTIGRVIAKALGIDKGVLYNLLTSKVVNAALGAAISDYIVHGKKEDNQ